MALAIDQANAVSSRYFNPKMVMSVYEGSTFYMLLRDRKRVDKGGIEEQFPIRYRKLDQTNWVDPNESITYTSKDTITSGVIERKYLAANNLITWKESVENTGSGRIVNLIKSKSEELELDFKDKFHDSIYVADPTGDGPDPISLLVDDGDLYGVSVSNGDAEDWKSQVVSASWTPKYYGYSATDGSQSLDQLITTARFGMKKPTHIICSRQMLSGLKAIFINSVQGRIDVDERTLKMGLNNFMFSGVTFVDDYACPDAAIYGLDMDSIGCKEDPGQPWVKPWFALEQQGLPHHMSRLMTWSGNLYISQRRTSFRIAAATLPTTAQLNANKLNLS